MAERMVTLERSTNETQIELTLDLDGTGRYEIDTGCGFLNHMLELFARHGRFDLVLTCHGDVQVDYHHTTEDVGIALGQAFARALGDMRGIQRYGSFYLPMDEALILCAVEVQGQLDLGLVGVPLDGHFPHGSALQNFIQRPQKGGHVVRRADGDAQPVINARRIKMPHQNAVFL